MDDDGLWFLRDSTQGEQERANGKSDLSQDTSGLCDESFHRLRDLCPRGGFGIDHFKVSCAGDLKRFDMLAALFFCSRIIAAECGWHYVVFVAKDDHLPDF